MLPVFPHERGIESWEWIIKAGCAVCIPALLISFVSNCPEGLAFTIVMVLELDTILTWFICPKNSHFQKISVICFQNQVQWKFVAHNHKAL